MQPLRLGGKAKGTFKMAQDGLQNASRAHGKRKASSSSCQTRKYLLNGRAVFFHRINNLSTVSSAEQLVSWWRFSMQMLRTALNSSSLLVCKKI